MLPRVLLPFPFPTPHLPVCLCCHCQVWLRDQGNLLSPQLILGAKCHMIRDTQILEKQLIAKELEEEEKRLAKMMEVERKKADEMQEELERRRKQELIRSAKGSPFPREVSLLVPGLVHASQLW